MLLRPITASRCRGVPCRAVPASIFHAMPSHTVLCLQLHAMACCACAHSCHAAPCCTAGTYHTVPCRQLPYRAVQCNCHVCTPGRTASMYIYRAWQASCTSCTTATTHAHLPSMHGRCHAYQLPFMTTAMHICPSMHGRQVGVMHITHNNYHSFMHICHAHLPCTSSMHGRSHARTSCMTAATSCPSCMHICHACTSVLACTAGRCHAHHA